MRAITTIGLDIAKSVFQVHGIDAEGNVLIPGRSNEQGYADPGPHPPGATPSGGRRLDAWDSGQEQGRMSLRRLLRCPAARPPASAGQELRSSHRSGLDQMRTDQFFSMWLP